MIIYVNGEKHDFIGEEIHYGQVVALAGSDPDGPVHSITYRAPINGSGILNYGDSVRVIAGMIFNAYVTGNS